MRPPTPGLEHPRVSECRTIDDIDRLTPKRQIDAFALFNQVREHGAYMVCAGPVPPAGPTRRVPGVGQPLAVEVLIFFGPYKRWASVSR